jgi:hypothetical protein
MSEKDLANVYDVEIEPLTDSDLESAGGGVGGATLGCAATAYCPSTTGCPPPSDPK